MRQGMGWGAHGDVDDVERDLLNQFVGDSEGMPVRRALSTPQIVVDSARINGPNFHV